MEIKVSKQPIDPGPAAWNSILPAAQAYPRLEDHQTADFVVVGAGFAGLSAARRLNELHPKCRIVLLEARTIAEGPAGRNSGFMIDIPHKLGSEDYAGSHEDDLQTIAANREAIDYSLAAAEQFNLSDEALIQSGKINAAASERGFRNNQNYARHLDGLGEAHEMLDERQMRDLCGTNYYRNGLFTPGTVMIQPALFVRGLATGISTRGVNICEHSPVTKMSQDGGSWRLETPAGSVSAAKVILAVNGHVESFGFFERRLMHIYLYASMTRELTKDECTRLGGEPVWGFTPADPLGSTVRRISGTGGDRIVVRNRFTWAPGRQVTDAAIKSIAPVHDRSFKARFPSLKHVDMEYRWGGLLCLSKNTTPAFGQISDNLYSACCQNGLGTVMGTLSGKLAAEMASGASSPNLQYMLSQPQPERLPPEPLAAIGANAYMRWLEFRAGPEL